MATPTTPTTPENEARMGPFAAKGDAPEKDEATQKDLDNATEDFEVNSEKNIAFHDTIKRKGNSHSGEITMAIPPLCMREGKQLWDEEEDDFQRPRKKNCKLSGMNAADIAALIPVFGEKGENFIRAEDWIRRVDTLRITHGWTQKITMVYAAMRLRGAAAF
uniref:Uncharacterized protein n=1 Tax=Lutzomyia longipalpis TaxID=7200 RepID=A0A1B0GJ58_LUTLO